MIINIIQLIIAAIGLIFYMPQAAASVNSDLNDFFNALGFANNEKNLNTYKNQAAGYNLGGSSFLRNSVRKAQLFSFNFPSWRAGCGGIDLFKGGFSYINLDNFVELSKQILNNAEGYAFKLALSTEVPAIDHVLSYVQSAAQMANNLNINSCEMSESLVGGVWPKMRGAQEQICKDVGVQKNIFADWSAAQQGCSSGQDDYKKSMDNAKSMDSYNIQLINNKNLLWTAIQRDSSLYADQELKEFLISLSGTSVYDDQGHANIYPSLINQRDIINALLYGGEATIYRCPHNDVINCLAMDLSKITINRESGLVVQVEGNLRDIVNSLYKDIPLTEQQKGFLNVTNLPVLKFMTLLSSLDLKNADFDITQYSQPIAADLLGQYLEEALAMIKNSLSIDDYAVEIKQQLLTNIDKAEQGVSALKQQTYQATQQAINIVQYTESLERRLLDNLSSSVK